MTSLGHFKLDPVDTHVTHAILMRGARRVVSQKRPSQGRHPPAEGDFTLR